MSGFAGIIVSDLDGTFLDANYRPALSAHALSKVTEHWRVVWATSRTVEEIKELRRTLHHRDDAIGENGGVCVCDSIDVASKLGRASGVPGAWIARLATDLPTTRAVVDRAFRRFGRTVRAIGDVSAHQLARLSEYEVADAARAQKRFASVVLIEVDRHDPNCARAIELLRSEGCTVTDGGRWISVVQGSDKGAAVRRWLDAIGWKGVVVGIGNAPNDHTLLSLADLAFVVRNETGHAADLAGINGAQLLNRAGTNGWMEMIDALNNRFGVPTP